MFKNKIEISRYKQNKVKIYDSKDCKKPKKKKVCQQLSSDKRRKTVIFLVN